MYTQANTRGLFFVGYTDSNSDHTMVAKATKSHSSASLQLDSTSVNSTGMAVTERLKHMERGSLLPMLPDEITTNLIIPRLPWRAMTKFSQLNHAWRAALRSPEFYELRAQASNSQTIVTIQRLRCIISLYDTATETWHFLPPPPSMRVGGGCGCVCVQGKLYIIGGNAPDIRPRNDVYVLDLAGQGRWKQCASMRTARKHFACAAYGGKIYVFGGFGAGNTTEVYDPDQDLWSDIAPMLSHRIEHKVVNIGDVFCVHMGTVLGSDDNMKWADSAEIYDPRKDHWTAVANFAIDSSLKRKEPDVAAAAVVIDGKLHGILDDWLYVYEEPLNSRANSQSLSWNGSGSWKALQSISWDVFQDPASPFLTNYCARGALAVANDGELLALVRGQPDKDDNKWGWTFLKSKGLGSVGKQLTWEKVGGSACSTEQCSTVSSWRDKVGDFNFSRCMSSIAGPW